METPTRFRIDGDQQTEFHADYYALQRAVDRSTLLLPLATLLGLERPDFVVPAVVWYTLILPGERGVGFYTPDVRRVRSRQATRFMDVPSIRMGGEPLTPEEEARLIDWCVLVEDSYDDVIAIAVRRTIRAILERGDAEDALIDAVMATENLFGHGAATEVTFRVTTALAHLLEPEPTKRIALRKELGNVYDVRSKVVHGAKITPNMRLAERKEEAIKTAVQALRILFKERPHLISDNERGMRLVLGAAGPEGHTPPAD